MNVSREKLASESGATGFRPEVLEKVIHLLNLLEEFHRHPFLQGRMALKGGTALNLFLFDVPRLSVDIDLNYIGASGREEMMAERPKFEQAIHSVCSREGMSISRLPTDHAGGKWRLRYASAFGGDGNLEVDLNFMFRIPLWPVVTRDSRPIGGIKASSISVLDVHELAAGKLIALFARHASRDLFDAHRLLNRKDLDTTKLRLGFVVYGAMNRKDWRTVRIDDVGFEAQELRNQLLPVVRTAFLDDMADPNKWAKDLVDECREALRKILPFTAKESEFLDRLHEQAEIVPSLLTTEAELMERIDAHPGLLWKAMNIRKHKGL